MVMSSLFKKYVMALTGFILVGFVIGHMLGNLQMFLHPDWINEYAYKLQNLPYGLLYIVRIVLLLTVAAHVGSAIALWLENRKAKAGGYAKKSRLQSSFASRTMYLSGPILLAFIAFHIAHFTTKNVHPEFGKLYTELEGVGTIHHVYDKLLPLDAIRVHDVYSMVAIGFSPQYWYVSVFYLIAMGLLCLHLSHGVASMFQSLGLRNATWRARLNLGAVVVGWGLFAGFGSLPLAGLLEAFPHQEYVSAPVEVTSLEATR